MAKLGRYEILQEIGRGGEGIVFLAMDPDIDRKVAIKTLPIAQDPSGALRAKLQKEAKATARLNHPNIVTVFEFALQDELAYIVMEYVAGKSLAELLQQGVSHDFWTICRYLAQAAEALDHAHAENVIHRDIKPENIMIPRRGGLKVADFGIAKILGDASVPKTRTGVVRGTPQYLSPEQIDLLEITGRADQFALAVVAYEWITGHRPFEGETFTELLTNILTKDPPPVSQYRDMLGAEVTAVLLKALSKQAANRYETCVAFVTALTRAIPQAAASGELDRTIPRMPVVAPPPKVPDPPPVVLKSGKGRLVPTLTAVAIAAAAAVAFWPKPVVVEAPKPVAKKQEEKKQEEEKQEAAIRPVEPAKPEPAVPKPAPKVQQQQQRQPEPVKPPPAQIAPPVETPVKPVETVAPPPAVVEPPAAPRGKYLGPPEGRFSWQGALAPGTSLTISASLASTGSIAGGGLPRGLEVTVSADPPSVQIVANPSAANGYRLSLKNTGADDLHAIAIRWREAKP